MLLKYETERLVLKVLKPDAAMKVLDFYQRDRELFEEYETDRVPDFYTIQHQHKILKFEYNMAIKGQTIRFYAFLKENPDYIIGTVCLHNITSSFYQSCEIGYKFSSIFHHQGYASEAIKCVMSVAFYDLNLHRITAVVEKNNRPSCRLLEKIGFTNEGILRDYIYLHGKWKDHYLYSFLRNDNPNYNG